MPSAWAPEVLSPDQADSASVASVDRTDDLGSRTKAVVIDPLGHPVAIGVEQRPT